MVHISTRKEHNSTPRGNCRKLFHVLLQSPSPPPGAPRRPHTCIVPVSAVPVARPQKSMQAAKHASCLWMSSLACPCAATIYAHYLCSLFVLAGHERSHRGGRGGRGGRGARCRGGRWRRRNNGNGAFRHTMQRPCTCPCRPWPAVRVHLEKL